jgi:hypothetical protein
MAPEPADWVPAVILLQPAPQGFALQRLQLYPSNAAAIIGRPEIDIAFATHGKRVPLEQGTLSIEGCIFSVPAGTTVEDNALVRFIRSALCQVPGGNGPAVMALTMSVPTGDPLVVWTFRPPVPATGRDLIFAEGPADGVTPRPVLRGRYVDLRAPSLARRVHLLNYTWQFSSFPYWIGGVLAIAGLLFSTGALLVFQGLGGRRVPASVGVGTGCLALSIGLLYAVLVPPFEAPDEPDHFLAFADLAVRPDLALGAAELARIGHLERIRFHHDERIRPVDVEHPYGQAWNADIVPKPISGRSRLTQALWWGVDKLTRRFDAPATLLAIRLVNAVVLAVALGAGVAILAAQGAGAYGSIMSLAFFLVPTLPFFGMHVSETSLLTATYVGFACVLAALVLDGPATHWLGVPIGVLAALMISGGRSAMPMIALVGAALAGRALAGTRGTRHRRDAMRQASTFWLGATVSAGLLVLASSESYSRGLWPGDAWDLPDWFKSAAEGVRDRSWVVALALPAGIVVELAAAEVRRAAGGRMVRARAVAVRGGAYAAAAAIVAVALVSLAIDMPTIAYFTPPTRPPLGAYLRDTFASVFTFVRLRNPDQLLSTFFWGGFGWLDTILPDALVTALVAISGTLGVWLLIGIGGARDERRACWVALLACGWTVTVGLSATGSYYLHRNLHGRYLVGAYLASLAIAWTAPVVANIHRGRAQVPSLRVVTFALVSCAALHAFALVVILRRYF